MPSFHAFARLPPELRLYIWKLAAESQPRDVVFLNTRPNVPHLIHGYAVVAPPATILQSCRESRDVGTRTHEKAFVDGPRYLWINFDIDAIQIPVDSFNSQFPEGNKIINLRLVDYKRGMQMLQSRRSLFSRLKNCDILIPMEELLQSILGPESPEYPYYLGWIRIFMFKISLWEISRIPDSLNTRVIRLDSGEYITRETAQKFFDWMCSARYSQEALASFPVVCSSEHIVPWTVPTLR